MFKHLPGDAAVLRQSGVFKTCDLYEYQGGLFAKVGSGYVRLHADGKTSKDGMLLQNLVTEAMLWKDRFGRIALTAHRDYTPIALAKEPGNGVLMVEDKRSA